MANLDLDRWYEDPETGHRFKLTAVRPQTVIVLDAWGNCREFARASWVLEMVPCPSGLARE